MAEGEKTDEKKGEAQEESSTSETKPEEKSSDDALIDELLADEKPVKRSDREIRVLKETYDEKNEKAKLLDELSPLLSKLKEKPELVDQALKSDDKSSLEQRILKIEQGEKQKKQLEVREVLGDALRTWPDLKDNWESMRPLVTSLEAQGYSYRDSVERAYYAINPEALAKERKSIAQERANAQGIFSSKGGSASVALQKDKEEDLSFLDDGDKLFIARTGIDPKAYIRQRQVFERYRDL